MYRNNPFPILLFLYCLLSADQLQAQSKPSLTEGRYNIIPYPSTLRPKAGFFTVSEQTTLKVSAGKDDFRNEATFLRQMIRTNLGADALKQNDKAITNTIILQYDSSISAPEGYALSVNSRQVLLMASAPAGMFHAIETFRQLLPSVVETAQTTSASPQSETTSASPQALSVPAVEITDQPAFPWRGMMLDVSRHFFSVAYVKKYIDMMALYKFNVLHLHLTDDQGWRIEIKKYPRLTAESAWRSFNDQDSANIRMAKETGNPDFNIDSSHIRYQNGRTEYGGFYTQEQMKDIIRYASSRHIEIIPEIDMPGHMMAAVRLYPWLTCDGTPGAGRRDGFSNPICPCKDSAMQFSRDVLSEIIDLFPSKYIHIGGDEVEKRDWAISPLCHAFMLQHNIKTLDQLQSYFNDQLQTFFRSRGKTLVGWDEIVDGGMDSSAIVMFWRTWARQAPRKAALNGNKVVMSADGPLYFDAFPDRNTLKTVYHYDPTDTLYGLNATERQNIIGVQANLWTEMVPTEQRADYLVMPRMTALAELGWTHRDLYDSYLKRLEGQYDRLDKLNIAYRQPDLPELADNHVFIDATSFYTTAPSPGLTIRYTIDGTVPVPCSQVLSQPIVINRSLTFRMAAFTAAGRRGDLYSMAFDRQAYAAPVTLQPATANSASANSATANPDSASSVTALLALGRPGLECRFYKGLFKQTTLIKADPDSIMEVQQTVVPAGIIATEFGLKFSGYIDVPETGIYSFFLTSNDGSVLHIAGRLVVDNDGLHSDKEKGGQVALEKGLHPFALDFMEAGGGYTLDLKYSKDDGPPRSIPVSWFRY